MWIKPFNSELESELKFFNIGTVSTCLWKAVSYVQFLVCGRLPLTFTYISYIYVYVIFHFSSPFESNTGKIENLLIDHEKEVLKYPWSTKKIPFCKSFKSLGPKP